MANELSSDHINYLIWRYLQESGYEDCARAFQEPTKADRLNNQFEPFVHRGHLIYLIHRGLQYEELRLRLSEDGSLRTPAKPVQFFPPVVPDEDEGVGPENGHMDEDEDAEGSTDIEESAQSPAASVFTSGRKHAIGDGANGTIKRQKRASAPDGDTPMGDAPSSHSSEESRITNGRSVGTQVEDVIEITDADTLVLAKEDDVTTCAWNPVQPNIVATGGARAMARIWNLSSSTKSGEVSNIPIHAPSTNEAPITVVRWSPHGDRLAVAFKDGETQIWTVEGTIHHRLTLHYAAIWSLAWNDPATLLLALACDGKLIVWNTETGESLRDTAFEFPKEEVIVDMTWISDSQFVVGSDRGSIGRFDAWGNEPPLYNAAHSGDVACVRWDTVTDTFASAGQDTTIQIWQKPTKSLVLEGRLHGHTEPIVALAWQPQASDSPTSPRRILASASNDMSVRVWDTIAKTCLNELRVHIDPLEKISFSPDGSRLASGANGRVLLWRIDMCDVTLTHVYDRLKTRRKNGVVADEDTELSELSWDEAGATVMVGEVSQKSQTLPDSDPNRRLGQCTIIRLNAKAREH